MSDINQKLNQSILQKLGKEGREKFEKTGELPAIKLSQEEMDYLKGAGVLDDLWRLIKAIGNKVNV